MLTRRSLIQGVLSLAALAPLGRLGAKELDGGSYPRVSSGPGWVCIQTEPSDKHWLYTVNHPPTWSSVEIPINA